MLIFQLTQQLEKNYGPNPNSSPGAKMAKKVSLICETDNFETQICKNIHLLSGAHSL